MCLVVQRKGREPDAEEDLHVYICGETSEAVEKATEFVRALLIPIPDALAVRTRLGLAAPAGGKSHKDSRLFLVARCFPAVSPSSFTGT